MNSSSSGGKLEKFFAGKGFYIVLFLCAAVIGVSAWMMASGNATMDESSVSSVANYDNHRVETVIVPGEPEYESVMAPEDDATLEVMAPPVSQNSVPEIPVDEPEQSASAAQSTESAQTVVWPVEGSVARAHSSDVLTYDVTLRDWRTHEGVDIAAEPGSPVAAACAGTVESIVSDPLYGTVLTIDHGNGFKTVYANLTEYPAVSVGQWVEPGVIVGSVGDTAICEIGQESHLHFAVMMNGTAEDPTAYLPG